MSLLADIPAAPRVVRWRTARRKRWLLGLIGGATMLPGVAIAVIFMIMGIDVLPLADDALDAECGIAPAIVSGVSDTGLHSGSKRYSRVEFRFRAADGRTYAGASLTERPDLFPADLEHRAEYLPNDPSVSRLRGTRRNPFGAAWTAVLGLVVLPAVGTFLWWLRGAQRLRLVLANGRLTLARIESCRQTFGVNPPQWRVRYSFDDATGVGHQGSQWVGTRTPLGRLLDEQRSSAPVIHDEGYPDQSRLVHATDFAS